MVLLLVLWLLGTGEAEVLPHVVVPDTSTAFNQRVCIESHVRSSTALKAHLGQCINEHVILLLSYLLVLLQHTNNQHAPHNVP
jgi:hypothetical protein